MVESRTLVNGQLQIHQRIHDINIQTGADRVAPVSIGLNITYPGTNPTGNGKVVSFDPNAYKERDALTLANGVVYTAWSSNADTPPYTGWVIGFRASNLATASVLNVNPAGYPAASNGDGPSGGTFWNSGGGFSVDSGGNLFNVSGNGPADAAVGDYGDSILKLSAANGVAVSDYFTPYNQQALANTDTDLGSSDVLLLPDLTNAAGQTVQLAVTAGKDGSIYVANRNNLGKYNASSNANLYQELPGALGTEEADAGAYFDGTVYYGANGQPLRAFSIANGKLSTTATSQTSTSFPYPGTSPTISSNGNANGVVWAVQTDTNQAVLHAYDATNLGHKLYNSSEAPNGRDAMGPDTKFIVPTVANGKVYVGTQSGIAVSACSRRWSSTRHSTPNPLVNGPIKLDAIGNDPGIPSTSLTYTWTTVASPAGRPPDLHRERDRRRATGRGLDPGTGLVHLPGHDRRPDRPVTTSVVTIQVALPRPASPSRRPRPRPSSASRRRSPNSGPTRSSPSRR